MIFAPIPEMPQGIEQDWQSSVIEAAVNNLKILTGDNPTLKHNAAVLRSDVKIVPLGEQDMMQTTATGSGYTISGQNVASLDDHSKLANDVQILANDLYYTRKHIDKLISQLSSGE